MDGLYKRMSIRASWKLTHGSLVDDHRNHETDFDAFAQNVALNLQGAGVVAWKSSGSQRNEYRDIEFIADRPIEQADWAKAVGEAATSCCVLSDQRMWSFE